jgi:hypothetical protein
MVSLDFTALLRGEAPVERLRVVADRVEVFLTDVFFDAPVVFPG